MHLKFKKFYERARNFGFNIYLVGGCVRDYILGRIPNDFDFCVEGATESQFLQAFPGAEKVGNAFPVFLYNKYEFAFARKELKTGVGHKKFELEFSPDTTIREDLTRRDLTINAMAMDLSSGEIIDIFGSKEDINNKILKHVGPAFREDPLRVYRVARFASQFGVDWKIHEDTLELMRDMKDETRYLSKDRIFNELEKALNSDTPTRFFYVLKRTNQLDVFFKELSDLINVPAGKEKNRRGREDAFTHTMQCLKRINTKSAITKYAVLCHDLGKGVTPKENWPHHYGHDKLGVALVESLSTRISVPTEWKRAAIFAALNHMKGHEVGVMRNGKLVDFAILTNKFPGGIKEFIEVLRADGGIPANLDKLFKVWSAVKNIKLPKGCDKTFGEKAADLLRNKRVGALKANII